MCIKYKLAIARSHFEYTSGVTALEGCILILPQDKCALTYFNPMSMAVLTELKKLINSIMIYQEFCEVGFVKPSFNFRDVNVSILNMYLVNFFGLPLLRWVMWLISIIYEGCKKQNTNMSTCTYSCLFFVVSIILNCYLKMQIPIW